ncbi:DUF3313 family protein [sulfur-oxidizing endosymbiont of Gigantopelta aegis]|uniref:DUF3313 family protein n=1 Tax=sulfur-oxidizing endosymbiont of Gigantopelta aegis TaxID=2794934 RepID=UPI0018DBB028|nr:DUF3313 family protein [sulfur-oxidizing endosymbiont of Gigantopelta aegis]
MSTGKSATTSPRNLLKKTLLAIAVSTSFIITATSLTGCQSTQPMSVDMLETEFLTDASLLQEVPGEPSKRFYEKQDVDWSQYHSVMIEDVTINEGELDNSKKMSRRDRLMMGIYFQNSMRMSVQKKYAVTNRPDSGVLIIRASISEANTGSTLGAVIGGDYGNVIIEGEIVDAMSGEPLVAIIDRQSGEFLSAYSNWDDVAVAFDEWSEQLYGVLQSHMDSSPTYERQATLQNRMQVASAPVYAAPAVNTIANRASTNNSIAISRPHINVDKQISSAANEYEQQQYQLLIDEQLIAAAGDLKADRLTAPPGKNAMERYNHVLSIDPDNAHAQDGLNIVASRYLVWAKSALTNGEMNKSRMYLSRAKNVNSTSSSISRSIAEVDRKLNSPIEAEAIAMVQTISNQPTAAGISQTQKQPPMQWQDSAKMLAYSPKPAVNSPKQVVSSKPVAKTTAKPQVTAYKTQPKAITTSTAVAKTSSSQPSPSITPVTVTSAASNVVTTQAITSVAVAPVQKPVQKVAYDPWDKTDMGSAQLNSSKLRPFVLGLSTNGSIQKIVGATKSRLKKSGFEIVGEYSPYNKATIIIVTNKAMKTQASKSKFGGYGAPIRIAVTQAAGRVQVSYTNPYYTQNIYRMKGDAGATTNKLAKTLGHQKVYGSNKGIAANDLRDWHYMFGMPYFDDQITLQKGSSYSTLVQTVENNLSSRKNGTKKVYRIDIPGKEETVFGVAITKGAGADRTVMGNIDVASVKHSAHLPYEILVSGNKAYMLNGKFRIAISFPDLTMGQFMAISSAPDSTEDTMKSIALSGAQVSSN